MNFTGNRTINFTKTEVDALIAWLNAISVLYPDLQYQSEIENIINKIYAYKEEVYGE